MSVTHQQRLIQDSDLAPSEEHELLEQMDPPMLRRVSQYMAAQRRRLTEERDEARRERVAAEKVLRAVLEPPWVPATVIRTCGAKLDVIAAGQRQVVGVHPSLQDTSIVAGSDVFVNREATVVVGTDPEAGRIGQVGTVVEMRGDTVVLAGAADDETVALCLPELRGALASGDRVLYRSDFPLVIERLEARRELSFALEPVPDVTFDQIGGLDTLVDRIRTQLDLHFAHAESLASYQLGLRPGILLAGPPGVGKTMLAKAIANHVAKSSSGARFLAVPPGALRGVFYGQTEAHIRQLFALARSVCGICVLFFDELDSFGARGHGIGNEIDSRVMGSFLHELNGIASADNLICIGATNRVDLVDLGLLRAGRFGDRVFPVPRPGRVGARQILSRYLSPDLPYADEDGDRIVDAAVSYLFAEREGAGELATVTLANSERREVRAPHVLSGALLASAAEGAKHRAAARHLQGGLGIVAEDLLAALDESLAGEALKLDSPLVAREMLDFPGAHEIARIELPNDRPLRPHRVMRAT